MNQIRLKNNRDLISYGPSGSLRIGPLSEGCVKCINGEKIVLYTTGSCSVGCAYCPIPEDRQKIDDVYINERKLSLDSIGLETLFDESEMCLADGVGITGGDPMEVPERTIQYIRDIREQFGKDYHLHLYTSGIFFRDNRNLIDKLFEAGLDELRFHPKQIRAYPIWEIAAETKRRFPDHSIGFEIVMISCKDGTMTAIRLPINSQSLRPVASRVAGGVRMSNRMAGTATPIDSAIITAQLTAVARYGNNTGTLMPASSR